MKINLACLGILCLFLVSCKKFLQEDPTGFITPSAYYTTEAQIQAAVNGTYQGLNYLFSSDIGVAVSPVFPLEYLTGYTIRPRAGADQEFLDLNNLINTNGRFQSWWNATYLPLENCNSVIAHISSTTVVDEATRNRYLGEVYFLRAWYYFQGVRLFGPIPLKTKPTTDLSDIQPHKASLDELYNQIVDDLTRAEASGLPWTDVSGHVNMGAVKSLLAHVYLTMAGYPLNKGKEYYQKCYDKCREVMGNGSYRLFSSYADLRDPVVQNTGEHIFMIQHNLQNANNLMHFSLMPYPEVPISVNYTSGGAMAPHAAFYASFSDADVRKQEMQFFYTRHASYSNPAQVISLPQPYIYKYWDEQAEKNGKSGANFPLIRYAQVLLDCAEARASLDGGTTTDAAAIQAYYQVHHRAFPAEPAPASLSFDEVYKERYWELCFEFQTWYDMLRTRKAFDVAHNRIVDLVGFKAPTHIRAFQESDLLFQIPYNELLKNPNLR